MLISIVAYDVPNSLDKRLSARSDHLARLKILDDAGRLVLAGPQPHHTDIGFTGSLIVAEFDDLVAAQAWADTDPYVAAGVYRRVEVKPFKQVFPVVN